MKRTIFILCCMFVLVLSNSVKADTIINGGSIGGSQPSITWDPSGSIYLIQGDSVISVLSTLTIQSGATVQFSPFDLQGSGNDPSLVEWQIAGNMYLNSSSLLPVSIGPQSGQSSTSWYGIIVNNGGQLMAESLTELTGRLYLQSGSSFSTLLNDSGDNGRISLNGNLSLAGNLLLNTNGLSSLPTLPITIFDLYAGRTISGTFANLPEGAIFTSNGYQFSISYHGGDGNDVVLTPVNSTVPLPPTVFLMGTGLLGFIGVRRRFIK